MTRMRATGAILSRCGNRRARAAASPHRPRQKKPLGPQEGPNGFGVNYPALYPVRGSPGLTGDLLGGAEVGDGSPVGGDTVGVADGGRGGSGGTVTSPEPLALGDELGNSEIVGETLGSPLGIGSAVGETVRVGETVGLGDSDGATEGVTVWVGDAEGLGVGEGEGGGRKWSGSSHSSPIQLPSMSCWLGFATSGQLS